MASIKIHAGDFLHNRIGSLSFRTLRLPTRRHRFRGEAIHLSQIAGIDMATEENVKRIGGTVGWGLAGGVLLGPAGLLAGLLLGGRKKNITFVARFRDGRRLLATTDSETYRKLQAAAFDQPKPRPIIPESDGDTGPGRFRIVGVERESGNDTALSIDAESPANAKVKAELKGIVVTSVTRDPS